MSLADPLHVRFVQNGIFPRDVRRAVVSPVEPLVRYGPERGIRGAVEIAERKVFLIRSKDIAKKTVVPGKRPPDGLRIGIEKHLVRIEPVAVFGVVWTMYTVPVALTRSQPGT